MPPDAPASFCVRFAAAVGLELRNTLQKCHKKGLNRIALHQITSRSAETNRFIVGIQVNENWHLHLFNFSSNPTKELSAKIEE